MVRMTHPPEEIHYKSCHPMTNKAYDILLTTLTHSQDKVFIQQLLSALLTDKEQLELANRIQIFALLQQGLPQREIAERLGVGIATVSRGAKAYQQHHIETLLPELKDTFLL